MANCLGSQRDSAVLSWWVTLTWPRAGVDFHRGYKGKHLPKEYIERGQIYFGFEVDEKLLPFAIEEFGDQCWVYGSDIPHRDRLYRAVDVFLNPDDYNEGSKRKLLVDNTTRF